MDKYKRKFGIKENKKTAEFHKSRRMFCIKNDKLHIAKSNLSYSHAVWFEKEGWMDETNDEFINKNVRGVIFKNGEICFYIGYNFQISKKAESIFFSHLKELVNNLNLKESSKITGGQIKSKNFAPRKKYGTIRDNLIK